MSPPPPIETPRYAHAQEGIRDAAMQTTVESKADTVPSTSVPLQCFHCEQTLSQQGYILHEGQPYCIHCYESKYSNLCAECGLLIATESKVVPVNINNTPARLYDVLTMICFICFIVA